MFSATPAAKSNSGGAGAGCWLMPANARLNHVSRATGAVASISIKWFNVDAERFSPAAIAAEALESPPLEPGESVIARASGVVLGWQPQTILIWWIPGLVFIALACIQTALLVVTLGLAVFCAGLFLFYASDREVRPRGSHRQYVLTDRRLIIAAAGKPPRGRRARGGVLPPPPPCFRGGPPGHRGPPPAAPVSGPCGTRSCFGTRSNSS